MQPMSKVVLSKAEVAQHLVEHLRGGILNGTIFIKCKDQDWMQTFIYLLNLHRLAEDEEHL